MFGDIEDFDVVKRREMIRKKSGIKMTTGERSPCAQ